MAVTGPPLIEARGLCVRFGKVAALDFAPAMIEKVLLCADVKVPSVAVNV